RHSLSVPETETWITFSDNTQEPLGCRGLPERENFRLDPGRISRAVPSKGSDLNSSIPHSLIHVSSTE
ncbi:MAG TPA: hypothetical protein VM715_14465, partial [Candidatus Acidoferrum sp.]|nr:hypothetical protein [Candidatus Acidoferrum sp.]